MLFKLDKQTFNILVHQLNSNRDDELEKNLENLLKSYPKSYSLINLKAVFEKKRKNYNHSIIFFKKAIKINPNISEAHNNLGLVYSEIKQLNKAINCFENAISIDRNNIFFYNNLANAYLNNQNLDKAEENFLISLELDKNFFRSLIGVAEINRLKKNYDKSIELLKKAISIEVDFPDTYLNLANTYLNMGEIELSIENYKICLNKNPSLITAYNNLAIALQRIGDYKQSITNCLLSLKLDSSISETHNILGNAFKALNKTNEAIEEYKKSVALDPKNFNAHNNLANIFVLTKDYSSAIENYKIAYNLNKNYSSALASLLDLKAKLGDWSSFEEFSKIKDNLGINGESIQPFIALNFEDNPENQKKRSINYFNEKNKNILRKNLKFEKYKNDKIKIGYFSSDFYDHATVRLIKGLLISYDKKSFEVNLFSYGEHAKDSFIDDIKNQINYFHDISDLSDLEILKFVRDLKIDIAIDLKGYTQGTRSRIFSYKLAPSQINFLGYPGTMGNKNIDYIIADKTIIPEEQKKNYSEKVIYMPYCYQPNDNQREISSRSTLRTDHNLSDEHFVLCCFNNTYKITPEELNIWIKILHKNSNTILWLLDTNELYKQSLKQLFAKNNLDYNRIKFAKRLSNSEHIERLRHADLFIDTFNCNAHTTCSDALWSNVPVVTKIGKQFSARVAASLLKSISLEELITTNKNEYENKILELIEDKNKLINIRKKLKENIHSTPLFDTKKYTKDFEKILFEIYKNNEEENF